MIAILSEGEIERMRRAGRAAAETLAFVAERIGPGVSTADVDRWVREHTRALGGTPSQLGYQGFPAAVCTSPQPRRLSRHPERQGDTSAG